MDKIGCFKGKGISTMSKEELLEFATWAAKSLEERQNLSHELYQLNVKRQRNDSKMENHTPSPFLLVLVAILLFLVASLMKLLI